MTVPLYEDAVSRKPAVARRGMLAMVGKAGGSAAMYQAMSTLDFAAESTYGGPIALQGAPKGTSVLMLGAGVAGWRGGGVAGLVAAFGPRRACYCVKVLEYNPRAGGRAWTIHGAATYCAARTLPMPSADLLTWRGLPK